jgi:cytochrome c-type biogenesis protein
MTDFAFALAAGMVAAVNPCGFALLPAYLSMLLISEDGPGGGTAAWRHASRRIAGLRALVLTGAMTIGFVAMFWLFALALGPYADAIQPRLPWFSILFAGFLVAVGAWFGIGRRLPRFGRRIPAHPTVGRSVPWVALFGVANALASLNCTIGPFQAVVVASLLAGATSQAAALFITYAAGMIVIVGVFALLVALVRTSASAPTQRVLTSPRACGVLLLISGGYLGWYGWYELRLLRGQVPDDPVIGVGEALQQAAVSALDRVGVPAMAVLFGALLVAVLVLTVTREPRV